MESEAQFWIDQLGLIPHPEGGFYRETYRSPESIPKEGLPDRYPGPRAYQTAIYFLLPSGQTSALHWMASDELWFFHAGGPALIHCLDDSREHRTIRIGPDPRNGEVLQARVPAAVWFGAEPVHSEGYTLASCTVAPGFEFEDFHLGGRRELLERFPQHADLIRRLCQRD